MALTTNQREFAMMLLAERPPTLPGTRVIPDDKARSEYYSKANQVMTKFGIRSLDDVNEFCNLCGIPD
jgi:hypothetical protein